MIFLGLGTGRGERSEFSFGHVEFEIICYASLVAQMVKRLSAMQETWVRSLGWEDPLEKEMAARSRTLAWKIPWMEEPGRLLYMGSQRVGHDWATEQQPQLKSKWRCQLSS